MNLLDNKQNELSKFRTRNWEINDESRGTCKDSNQINLKLK